MHPTVCTLLVGDNPSGAHYARVLERSAQQVNLETITRHLTHEASTEELVEIIAVWNADPNVCGILVQLPLPSGIDQGIVVSAIDPLKDLDGANPVNFGRMAVGLPGFAPCTAEAIVELAKASELMLSGAACVVVGRSNVVGKPAALLLLREHATVTLCHTRTRELPAITRSAQLVVAAAGRAGIIRGDMLASGCVVIDAGTNATENGLVGDVDAATVRDVARVLTPVPGGVGPVTNAILMRHAAEACERLRR
jgi:methylenetetrahydrofolate dehydrogenase (NADP+)/methenyltetrahydrofolate cyclohydrolase